MDRMTTMRSQKGIRVKLEAIALRLEAIAISKSSPSFKSSVHEISENNFWQDAMAQPVALGDTPPQVRLTKIGIPTFDSFFDLF